MNNKKRLFIVGAGGQGKVVADIALKMNRWQQIAFLDNEVTKSIMGIEIFAKASDAFMYIEDCDIFVAIGNNEAREMILMQLESAGASMPTLVHPSAIIGEHVELGCGTAVMAGAVINCCTSIGKGCIVNTGATIDHDNIIEDYVHISPGVHTAGTVKIGRGSWLGIGSIVSNNVCITSDCKIGGGALVLKDIIESGTYVGVPVRRV